MNYIDIILLAFALSIDVCVVSFSYGLCLKDKHKRSALLLSFITGLFHMFMPILGYYFTDLLRVFIEPYANFIVFMIFMYLGVSFILDSFKNEGDKNLCLNVKNVLLVAIATSIDVFSAGISLSLTSSPMKFSVMVMGLMAFTNSLVGYFLGFKSKIFKSSWLEIIGGLILIGLAIKTLI